MTATKDLSIVIPCFNEAKNVSDVLKQLKELIADRSENIEVIVIDGASTDNTPLELQTIFESLPSQSFRLILNDKRGGYGGDIMQALSVAEGAVLSWTHADLQTDPSDVLTAYDTYLKHSNPRNEVFIKGHRRQRRLLEAFFSFGMELYSFVALRTYLSEINAQPKMFSREFYQSHLIEGHPTDFSLDLYALFLAKRRGSEILHIPVYFKKRLHGEAKGGGGGWKARLKLIKRTASYIVHLRKYIR